MLPRIPMARLTHPKEETGMLLSGESKHPTRKCLKIMILRSHTNGQVSVHSFESPTMGTITFLVSQA